MSSWSEATASWSPELVAGAYQLGSDRLPAAVQGGECGRGLCPNIFQMWPQLPDSLAPAGALGQQAPVGRAVRKTKLREGAGGPASRKGRE
jgi:hypothetical protein